jgi:AhpD family alkylhydroperoxidase
VLRVEIPEGAEPAAYVWGNLAPDIAPAAITLSASVYAKAKLPLRLFEAMRIRVAQINGCEMCQSWRAHRDTAAMLEGYGVSPSGSNLDDPEIPGEDFYAAIENWPDAVQFSDRERVAIEFTDRYVTDPRRLEDEEFWAELHRHFTDEELVEMMLSIGAFVTSGRLQAVLGIDDACQIGSFSDSRG